MLKLPPRVRKSGSQPAGLTEPWDMASFPARNADEQPWLAILVNAKW
jgi:hypothetical protein